MSLSEVDERMRRILDNDAYQRSNETKFADLLQATASSANSSPPPNVRLFNDNDNSTNIDTATQSSVARSDGGVVHKLSGSLFRSSSSASGRFYDWPDGDSRGSYRWVDDDHNDAITSNSSQRSNNHGILSVIAVNCLPSSYGMTHNNNNHESNSSFTRRKKSYLPILLLALILYGTISMILDVGNSIYMLHKYRMAEEQFQIADRFPGGFVSVDQKNGGDTSKLSMKQMRSFDLSTTIDEPMNTQSSSITSPINMNAPTISDVPQLTEQILSTTFQHVLPYAKNDIPYENEVVFYWTCGNTMNPIFTQLSKCFPDMVQASGGTIFGSDLEESLRKFPSEITLMSNQQQNGGKFVNVDLFTPEGVKRAADLNLLFPSMQYPVFDEMHYNSATLMVSADRTMTEGESNGETDATTNNIDTASILASKQIQLLVSPFLPEVANGLFAPSSNNNANTPIPPKAKVHSIMLPTTNRLRAYHQMYTSTGGMASFLEFITSSNIFVNNYITRILSGQWDENAQVTEVHLEIAKNVISQKIHMWPNRGAQDMFSYWAEMYGWQNDNQQGEQVLGIECLYPPPDPDMPPPVRAPPPEPTEMELEMNKIMGERSKLDDELFLYVVQLYDSWMASR